jgi:hypothetical protein
MSKNKITLFSILVAIIGISAIALLGMAQTQQNNDKKEIKVRNTQLEKEKSEPTVIQEGIMTEKQKKHSKIYKGYKDRAKIRDLINQHGDIEIEYPIGDVRTPQIFNLDNYLQDLLCKADAVVIGRVKNKASQINEDGTFIFTDYEFIPEEALKDNANSPIKLKKEITISRTGGAIKLNGRTAQAIDYRQVPLIQGEHYLLFLKYFPEMEVYRSISSSLNDDSFQILGNRVKQVSRHPLPFSDGSRTVEADEFINKVRVAVGNVCTNQGGIK